MIDLLQKINELPLVTGFEHHFVNDLQLIVESYTEKKFINIDNNLLHIGKGNIVYVAHYDEIGFIIDNHYHKNIYRTIPMGLTSWQYGYGRVYQTIYKNEKIYAIGSSPMPHAKPADERLFLEVLYDQELPALWPFSFENKMVKTNLGLYTKSLDDKAGVVAILEILKEKDISVLLTAGEEQGTTRLENTIKYISSKINNPSYIIIDATFSSEDYHVESGIPDGEIGYTAIEGGGVGNKAPKELIDYVKKFTDIEIKTTTRYEVTDATTFWRRGAKAISIQYSLKYLHSPLEYISFKTYEKIKSII